MPDLFGRVAHRGGYSLKRIGGDSEDVRGVCTVGKELLDNVDDKVSAQRAVMAVLPGL